MKLFTIGDSISQGFMSGAAARTDLCYSTLIAKQLKINGYQYPIWDHGGMPANIEEVFRALEKSFGANLSTMEWGLATLKTLPAYLDKIEDYYERGEVSINNPYSGGESFFSNVSVRGFNVSDSWLITSKYCKEQITSHSSGDGIYSGVDNSFLRTALRVLNPQLLDQHQDKSQLDWLKYHSDKEGVDNVIIWLGANNALGSIVSLKINFTEGKGQTTDKQSDIFQNTNNDVYNLWHPEDFKADYTELLNRIDGIIEGKPTKVFLGTVPLVTIAPLVKGVGDTLTVEVKKQQPDNTESSETEKVIYSKYYTYFPFDEEYAFKTGINLSFSQVYHIDKCIREYNKIIKNLVAERNLINPGRYHIIDYSSMLDSLAFKRNGGTPTYEFPDYFKFKYPLPDTKYYHADTDGNLKQGGIFSLDGVHPTPIAHGLIAYETLKKMNEAGVENADPNQMDWNKIIASDKLYTKPITMMHEIYDNRKLAEWLMERLKKVGKI